MALILPVASHEAVSCPSAPVRWGGCVSSAKTHFSLWNEYLYGSCITLETEGAVADKNKGFDLLFKCFILSVTCTKHPKMLKKSSPILQLITVRRLSA